LAIESDESVISQIIVLNSPVSVDAGVGWAQLLWCLGNLGTQIHSMDCFVRTMSNNDHAL